MNDKQVLKGFIGLLGIPFRPYKEIMEELGHFMQKEQIGGIQKNLEQKVDNVRQNLSK